MGLIESNEVVIRDGRSHMEEYDLARDTVTVPRKKGWAVRPPWGKQYGAHYIKDYAGRISELFHVGEVNTTQKMSPAQMLEVLQKENPGCYKLPTEMDIRTEISKLAAQAKTKSKKKDQAAAVGQHGPCATGSLKWPEEVSTFFETLVSANPSISRKDAIESVRNRFGDDIRLGGGGRAPH